MPGRSPARVGAGAIGVGVSSSVIAVGNGIAGVDWCWWVGVVDGGNGTVVYRI